MLPGLRERMDVCFHYTPQDFATDLGAHLGSAFSLEPILTYRESRIGLLNRWQEQGN